MNNSDSRILITLIVFIILTLGLGVGEYFTAKSMSEAKNALASNNEEMKKIQADNSALVAASKRLRDLTGYGYSDDTDAKKLADSITQTCDEIAGRWNELTGNNSEAPKTCLEIIDGLVRALNEKNQMLATSENNRDEYEQMAFSEEAKTKGQLEEFDSSIASLTEENQQRLQEANRRNDDLSSENDKLVKQVDTIKAEAKAVNEQYKAEAADAKEDVASIAGINEELRSKIEQLTDPVFEIPDGKIVYVDQSSRVVRLDIGEADGVRLLTTFGVFPADSLERGELRSKGSLEIIRIVGEHESEARILDDEMENPFTPGDLIYTPLWKAGTEVNVALDYFLDVDGDHKDDLDLLVRIINATGANVKAWITKSGDIQGKVTPEVTYLIVSDSLITDVLEADQDTSPEIKNKIKDAHTKLLSDAEMNSVRTMKLSEFLRRTHYKQSVEVSRYQDPGGLAKKPDRSGAPVVSDAAIAPIYDNATKDAKVNSFGVTAPIYDSNTRDASEPSAGRVSDTYFRKRNPKEL